MQGITGLANGAEAAARLKSQEAQLLKRQRRMHAGCGGGSGEALKISQSTWTTTRLQQSGVTSARAEKS